MEKQVCRSRYFSRLCKKGSKFYTPKKQINLCGIFPSTSHNLFNARN